jgi:hypothetical protein
VTILAGFYEIIARLIEKNAHKRGQLRDINGVLRAESTKKCATKRGG